MQSSESGASFNKNRFSDQLEMINGNARLSLKEIEIKDASEWSQVRLSDFKLRVGNRLDQVLSHSSIHSSSEKNSVMT